MVNSSPATPPQSSLEVRSRLVEALRLDLVGPGPDDENASPAGSVPRTAI